MIYAYATLTGYVALRGSMMIHFAMLIVMLTFVRIPPEGHIDSSFPGGGIWYIIACVMHAVMGLLHVSVFLQLPDGIMTAKVGFQMVACLAQVLNFTTMLNLFANSPTWNNMTDEERIFEVWIFIEALNIMSTVACNVAFILFRSVFKNQLDFDFDDPDD